MRTIIAGSRTITDYKLVESAIKASGFNISRVVSGGARGPDSLGELWARLHSVPVNLFFPKWKEFGRGAGLERNLRMAQNADALIAVWDGESKGTRHMIQAAEERGLKVFVKTVTHTTGN